MANISWQYGRRFGKTLATILWLLEDPDEREVWCSSFSQATQFIDCLMQFEDPRVLAHGRDYWANRVVIGKLL